MTAKTYLPYINGGVAGQGEPPSNALALFNSLRYDANQKRFVCLWDERVAAVAQARADMQLSDGAIFIHHSDKQGHGPNWWLRHAGIALPDWYDKGDEGNNVESIGLNYATATDCWAAFLASPTHRAHALGYAPTFTPQTQIGIGYARGIEKTPNFWVLISVPPFEEI